jgi:hypothetical protein
LPQFPIVRRNKYRQGERIMETVANQKTVKTAKEVCNKENLYAMYNLDAL